MSQQRTGIGRATTPEAIVEAAPSLAFFGAWSEPAFGRAALRRTGWTGSGPVMS